MRTPLGIVSGGVFYWRPECCGMAKVERAAEATVDFETRLARLEAAEKALADREAALAAMASEGPGPGDSEQYGSGAGPKLNQNTRLERGPNPYRFVVSCVDKTKKIEPREFLCCDEVEAMRYFAATTPDPDSPGRALDTTKTRLVVKCLDEQTRNLVIAEQQRKANLRRRYDMGAKLTDEEMEAIGF